MKKWYLTLFDEYIMWVFDNIYLQKDRRPDSSSELAASKHSTTARRRLNYLDLGLHHESLTARNGITP